jgi:hypothetical protein
MDMRAEDNIKMDLWERGWEGADWIHLVKEKERWPDPCEHGNETLGSINGGIS